MAVAAKGGVVAIHFGHAKEFLVYEATAVGAKFVGHRKADAYCSGDETCPENEISGESVLNRTIRALEGCEVVLCARIGIEPWGNLEAAGIQPNGEHAMEPIEEAVMAVWNEMLAAGKLDARSLAKSA
jgi:nitrogen fixation protein NifB